MSGPDRTSSGSGLALTATSRPPRRSPLRAVASVSSSLTFILLVLVPVILCGACGRNAQLSVSYKPEFLPVEFTISPSGISVEGSASIVTPIGTFSIGASYSLPSLGDDSIYVIIRDKDTGFDHIYKVNGGTNQLTAVVNGTTRITVTGGEVLIDVSAGSIESIRLEKASAQISVASSPSSAPTAHSSRSWTTAIVVIIGIVLFLLFVGFLIWWI